MSEALQLGPPAASSYCHQQDYYTSKQASSSPYSANKPLAQEPSESHLLQREAPPSAPLEAVSSSSRPKHANHQQRAQISAWSGPHRQVQRLIEQQQQQASASKHFETGSDNRLNSFHNRTNFHEQPAHRRSSSPSDASPMMRAPALYRPDTGDSGGAGPLMATSLPAPPCPQAGVGGGGQRAAFKLAGAQQPHQPAHPGRKMPICQRSTWPAGPHSPGQAEYGDYDEQQSDECSCSSSIDCLSSPSGELANQAHLHQPARGQPHHVRQPPHLASDDDCSFIQQRPHQHHHHHHNHHHHQTFHDHRPLMPHSSVPPYTGASVSPHPQQPPLVQQHQQAAQQQQQQQQPPPLLRQTTYTATSDTITDSAPGGGLPIPLTPPPPPVMGSTAAGSAAAAPNQADMVIRANAYHTMSRLEQKQGVHYSKQRQTVSFRRSATADYAADMKQQPAGVYSDNNGQNDDKSHKALLHRQRSAGINLVAAGRATGGAQAKQSSTVSLSRTTNSNNSQANTNSNAKINGQPGGQLRPASLHNHSSTSPLSVVANNDANQHHHQHQQHLNTTAPMTPAGGYPPGSPLPPSQAIRAGLLAPLTTTFDGVCSLPAITSHRTNSPWMRISSIILAPIGLIIILFIVVSPLLHYLM